MQFEQVIIGVVEIDRAPLARDPGPAFAQIQPQIADRGQAGVVIGLSDLEGDVVIAARGQRIALHRGHPDAADVEEALG